MGSVLKRTWDEFVADNCFRMAAALAYHAIFALAPLLVLVITILGLAIDPAQLTGEVERQIAQFIGVAGAEQVRLMMTHMQDAPTNLLAAVLSGLAILVGAAGLMHELQTALNEAWKVEVTRRRASLRGLALKRLLSFLLLVPIALVLLLSMLASAAIALFMRFSESWVGQDYSSMLVWLLDFAAMMAVYVLAFAAIFKYVPDTPVAWRHALAGGLFTAICFMAGRYAISVYLGRQDMSATYGAAGSLVLVLVWIYYSSLILLLGAEFTQVWSATSRKSGLRMQKSPPADDPSARAASLRRKPA